MTDELRENETTTVPASGEGRGGGGSGGSGLDDGKLWALLSYASMLVGFPLFIVPLAMRRNEFALFHARHAAAIYIGWAALALAVVLLSMVTCGAGAVGVPLLMMPYIPTIHGLILAAQDRREEPALLFGLGEAIFGRIEAEGGGPQ